MLDEIKCFSAHRAIIVHCLTLTFSTTRGNVEWTKHQVMRGTPVVALARSRRFSASQLLENKTPNVIPVQAPKQAGVLPDAAVHSTSA